MPRSQSTGDLERSAAIGFRSSAAAIKQDASLSIPVTGPRERVWNPPYVGLDRPVAKSDIEFFSGYDVVARNSLQIAWLMLRDFGYSMKDVRDSVMTGLLDQPHGVKMTHIIEVWRDNRKEKATARALVDICCHQSVGANRSFIESCLMRPGHSNSVSGVIGEHISFKPFVQNRVLFN